MIGAGFNYAYFTSRGQILKFKFLYQQKLPSEDETAVVTGIIYPSSCSQRFNRDHQYLIIFGPLLFFGWIEKISQNGYLYFHLVSFLYFTGISPNKALYNTFFSVYLQETKPDGMMDELDAQFHLYSKVFVLCS